MIESRVAPRRAVHSQLSPVSHPSGVRIRGLFAGESKFHTVTDASKVAVVATVEWLRSTGGTLFDVQWRTDHLASLGAVEISRDDYLVRAIEATGETVP